MRRFLRGFGYAGQGIAAALREERNFRFHLCAAAYVLAFGRFYPFGRTEWALLFLCIAGVIALELVNSAVERAVDRPDEAHWSAAGAAKDMAAGAVLVFSIGAAAVGVSLFWQPDVLHEIWLWLWEVPLRAVGLALSFAAAVLFVFLPEERTRRSTGK
ncbi:MAG: diacylglycerol kinase family protein [Oscillospiraceae bacterium]|nr:diacylglycerol kinase family protein [Oscillospiraceae bacterium]